MKIAVSADSSDLNQAVNPVFGRCPGFIIIEAEGKEVKNSSFIPNSAMNAAGGAGIAAAQTVINSGVQAVISGNFGPNAFLVLEKAGIKAYHANGITVKSAIEALADGKLSSASQPNVADRFGMGAGRGMGLGAGRGRGRQF